jgi:hypothetical protein
MKVGLSNFSVSRYGSLQSRLKWPQNNFCVKKIFLKIIETKNSCQIWEELNRSLSLKNAHLFSKDYCQMLSRNSKILCKFYNLENNLTFEKIQGGIVNPPILVRSKGDNTGIGVLKVVKESYGVANTRLKLLEKLRLDGFTHLPIVYRTTKNEFLSKIEGVFFYFIQFLPAENFSLSFRQFLEVTGELHKNTKKIPRLPHLVNFKLNEYEPRAKYFLDSWFSSQGSTFNDSLWSQIVDLSQYFISKDFKDIYHSLPTQLIHGDNNQTNILLSKGIPYFIDFDSLRFDVRLLDLASYLRYGGFKQYVDLTRTGKFFPSLNSTYEKKFEVLTSAEKKHFHLIVAFSHIEFLAWSLKELKEAKKTHDQKKSLEFLNYIQIYKKQMEQIIKILSLEGLKINK